MDETLDRSTLNRIYEIMDAYGVDWRRGRTYLGEGAYKEVHRTNIEGVAMFITRATKQLEDEMFILEMLSLDGYPMMEYYCTEKVGDVTIALGQLLVPPNSSWDSDKVESIRDKVEEYLYRMLDSDYDVRDLQFLLDLDDNPVFCDPLSLNHRSSYWEDSQEAYCKDEKRHPELHYVRVSSRDERKNKRRVEDKE
jgi:hypothetical protein